MTAVDGYYHLLVGVLNSEYDNTRSFVPLYGFTEILPGRVTTDRIVSQDGKTYFDLAKGEIGGIIKFLNNGTYDTLIDGGYIKTNLINAQQLQVARVLAGDEDGKRIVISPDDKAVYIYDENNQLVTVFEGNEYKSINELFGNTTGSAAITNASDSVDLDNTEEHRSNILQGNKVISNVFFTDTPAVIAFTGSLHTNVVSDANAKNAGFASAYLRLYVETYDDKNLTKRTQKVLTANSGCWIAGNDSEVETASDDMSLTNKSAKVIAGYHRIVVEWELQVSNFETNNQTDEAHANWSNITAEYKTNFYISRFFANGFVIGSRRDNYVLALNDSTNGICFSVNNGGREFEVGSNGIRYKTSNSSQWHNLA